MGATPAAQDRSWHMPIAQRHQEGQLAEGVGNLRERQIRCQQRGQGGGSGDPQPAIGAGPAPAEARDGRGGATP